MRRTHEGGKGKKVFGYILIFIMFGSVFTFIFFGFNSSTSSSGVVDYNGFEFVNRGTYWSTIIDSREALFTYLPDDLGFIFVNNDATSRLRNKVQIDITSDFEDVFAEPIALAQFQMGITLNNFNVFVRGGFTSEHENFNVLTCDDASGFVPVIYFRSANTTKVYLEGNCVIAEASNGADVIRIKDRLVYSILGII
tara:strand:- start:31818 stop:32405 length:588 start_codon:yes stop_codon:yes gene_type:complete